LQAQVQASLAARIPLMAEKFRRVAFQARVVFSLCHRLSR
jgi:hypothetical protein